ncbi:MAG: hypothetical protein IPJ74_24075 [Saprospiraceae bacterium]|nr:hypothetical protein [Saprospiraceae bacterium]
MLQLSYWAKTHPWQARWFIVVAHLLLIFIAIRFGLILFVSDIYFTDVQVIFAISIFSTGWLFYPLILNKTNYLRQKCCDFLLALGTFLLFTTFGNHLPKHLEIQNSITEASATFTALKAIDEGKSAFSKKWKQPIKQYIKHRIVSLKQEKASTKQVLLIILVGLVAAGLLLLLAAVSCSISCNGADGLAILVLIAGLVGLTFLTIFLIRRILGKHKRRSSTGG